MGKTATAAYRADLGSRDQPFGGVDGDWITVASVLQHASLVDEPAKSELLREAVELATGIVGEAEVQRLAAREWQDRDRAESEAIIILSDTIHTAGALNLAATMLDALLDADTSLNVVQRGRILAKRARIDWKAGKLDEAADRYRNLESVGRRSKSAEVKVRAWIGFLALSQIRQDSSEMDRYARRAARLAERNGLTRLAREAHSGLMIAAGIGLRLDDALVEGWIVYQLSIGDPLDEAEILLNLAQVLLDSGFVDVARAAFASVASRELAARWILPALGGLALASAASKHDLTTAWAARELLGVDPMIVPRYTLASALFESAVALSRIGRTKIAMQCRDKALQLAEQYGFPELAMEFERLDAPASASSSPSPTLLNKRAANIVRQLSSLEPGRLPRHIALATASA